MATSPRSRAVRLGLLVVAVGVVLAVVLIAKQPILTALRPGETLALELPRNYKLDEYASVVKVGGTEVGVVSGVEDVRDGTRIDLKLDSGTRALLGTAPSAHIRPTTILGGRYYVALEPGGERGTFEDDAIPADRTTTPVELDEVLAAVPPDAQAGLRGTVERLDTTFESGAGDALARVARTAPATLEPGGVVLDALRGTRPDTDLARTVADLDATAAALTRTPGRLRETVDALAGTARVLATNAGPVDQVVASLPDVLRRAREGAARLGPTLDLVTDVAGEARPAVRELDGLLDELDPALAELRPVLADLRPVLEDARPLVDDLTPAVERATEVVRDLRGPVLDRVNGPISDQILTEWHGTAPKYPNGGGTGNLFYEELGYMFAHINSAVKYANASAHMLAFQPGAGTTSVTGTGEAAQQLQNDLSRMWGPPHQEPSLDPVPSDGIRPGELIGGPGR